MLVVEPVRSNDLDRVSRLAISALTEQYGHEWLADHMQGSPGAFMVARDVPTNQVVGFALAEHREACEAHLVALAVDRRRRGQGIGSALLRSVRTNLANSGAFRMSLEVRADDPRSQAFYAHHGFSPEGVESHVYSDGADAVKMASSL